MQGISHTLGANGTFTSHVIDITRYSMPCTLSLACTTTISNSTHIATTGLTHAHALDHTPNASTHPTLTIIITAQQQMLRKNIIIHICIFGLTNVVMNNYNSHYIGHILITITHTTVDNILIH